MKLGAFESGLPRVVRPLCSTLGLTEDKQTTTKLKTLLQYLYIKNKRYPMDDYTLDHHLAKKDLREILSVIKKAGYRNSFMHPKGYILTKKSVSAKVRISLDDHGQAIVSTVPIGKGGIIGHIALLVTFAVLGGVFIIVIWGYILVVGIPYLISLPKTRAFKAEIEEIILSS